jgi:hypothetical protein
VNCSLTIFIEITVTNSGKLSVWVHLCSRYQSIAQLTWGNNMWLAKQQEGRENPCTGGKCQSYQNAVFCKMHPLVDFCFLLLFLRNFILHINMTLCLVTQLFEEFEKKTFHAQVVPYFILHIFYYTSRLLFSIVFILFFELIKSLFTFFLLFSFIRFHIQLKVRLKLRIKTIIQLLTMNVSQGLVFISQKLMIYDML